MRDVGPRRGRPVRVENPHRHARRRGRLRWRGRRVPGLARSHRRRRCRHRADGDQEQPDDTVADPAPAARLFTRTTDSGIELRVDSMAAAGQQGPDFGGPIADDAPGFCQVTDQVTAFAISDESVLQGSHAGHRGAAARTGGRSDVGRPGQRHRRHPDAGRGRRRHRPPRRSPGRRSTRWSRRRPRRRGDRGGARPVADNEALGHARPQPGGGHRAPPGRADRPREHRPDGAPRSGSPTTCASTTRRCRRRPTVDDENNPFAVKLPPPGAEQPPDPAAAQAQIEAAFAALYAPGDPALDVLAYVDDPFAMREMFTNARAGDLWEARVRRGRGDDRGDRVPVGGGSRLRLRVARIERRPQRAVRPGPTRRRHVAPDPGTICRDLRDRRHRVPPVSVPTAGRRRFAYRAVTGAGSVSRHVRAGALGSRRAAAHRLPHVPRQAARRWPGRLHPPPHQGARRPRPPRRGVQRPAVPGARRAHPARQLPSLDIFNDHYPGPLPRATGRSRPARTCSSWPSSPPARSASRWRSATAPCARCAPRRRRVRPRARQPVPRLRDPAGREADPDDRHAAPPDHQGPPAGDGPRAEPAQAALRRPLVLVREDAGPRRRRGCRASSSSARTRSTTSTRHGRRLDRMRLVPVGVDPELFRPLPGHRPRARPADHHGVGRRRPEGSVVPARGDGQAAHRARRHADDHRQAARPARATT